MTKLTYRLSELAQLDLRRLSAFLAAHNVDAANKALDLLSGAFERLAHSPWSGRRLQGDVRVLIVRFGRGAYRITYKVATNAIVILRPKHNREL